MWMVAIYKGLFSLSQLFLFQVIDGVGTIPKPEIINMVQRSNIIDMFKNNINI